MEAKKFYLVSSIVQLTYAGMNILSKAVLVSGMSNYIFIFYRQLVGTILLVLTTILFKRRSENVSLSFINLCKIFGIALIGTIVSETYGVAIDYTSATFGAAASNCIPITTFLFAILFKMEKVNVRRKSGMAKLIGIVVCTASVATLTFYKGHYFKSPFTHHFFQAETQLRHQPSTSSKTWILGCVFLVVSSFSSGLWLVLQARFLEHFPCPIVFVCLQSAMSSIQSLVVAVAIERDPSQWKLGWNIRLISLAYCGIFIVVVANLVRCWVIKHKGPVFHAMTTPLELVMTIMGSGIVLCEGLYLGSILGAVLLVTSLYTVLWGKSQDKVVVGEGNDRGADGEGNDRVGDV